MIHEPASDALFDIGIVGAGQLARMTCLAAAPLGVTVIVLGAEDDPASQVAAHEPGDWNDAEAVARLGTRCRVVTLENEFVAASALAAVEAAGTPVYPRPESVAVIQDKARQKERLRDVGLPLPRFLVVENADDLEAAGRDLGWPLVMKARTLGYDGYGNAMCHDINDAREAMPRLDRGEGVLVEEFIAFERELAAMVARSTNLDRAVYPVVETVQRNHICHEVRAPAPVDAATNTRASEIAEAAADAAESIGVMGVELFLLDGGAVMINELAPRPHNSGHYTIEACVTSQFENHVRGVMGLPLGDTSMVAPGAVMVNILGSRQGPSTVDLEAPLGVTGAHLHLYGKKEVRVGRKMGHVTALADSPDAAYEIAARAAEAVAL